MTSRQPLLFPMAMIPPSRSSLRAPTQATLSNDDPRTTADLGHTPSTPVPSLSTPILPSTPSPLATTYNIETGVPGSHRRKL